MKYRVLPPQFELMDSERLCIFQLLDILHFLFIAPELLRDQDLHTPADNMNNYTNNIIYIITITTLIIIIIVGQNGRLQVYRLQFSL